MHNKWNLQDRLVKQIIKKGGWVNTHTHLDRAYTITPAMLSLANEHLHKKWSIVDEIKRNSSVAQIYDRMSFAVEEQIKQGVTVLGSFIDVDDVIKDKSIKAAQMVKDKYKDKIQLVFINQALKGVIEPSARKWFDKALEFVDIIGGLPAKDAGREEEHLDILFEAAKRTGKMLHVHVDQLNTKAEKELELLIKKTKEHHLENRVVAIHGISLSAHPKKYREKIYKQMREAGVMLISCPTAWIDSRRSEELSVTHNSIAPVEELVAAGITVGIGADNIADVYKPFTDGDMWTELRFMLESCHFYDIPELINISTKNGRKILGVDKQTGKTKKSVQTVGKPFYDPNKTYQDNYQLGPFGGFEKPRSIERVGQPQYDFFGHRLYQPFGIPAGPLVNAKFVSAAFKKGFDVCTYKTVRTREYPCHPHPNVLAVHLNKLGANRQSALKADQNYSSPLSITNSFGVPSTKPKIWQKDMRMALKSAGKGQVLIGSFQGTSDGSGKVENYIKDFVKVAKLVKETGTPILEANLSCPNEGTANVLCFDTKRTKLIAQEIKKEIGETPLILKLAYFSDDKKLEKFVKELGNVVDGFSAINTIAAKIVDKNGEQALPGKGRERSGVCGTAISWAGLDMVKRLKALREKLGMNYVIIGVGGVTVVSDFSKYRKKGADLVMSATGAMWNTDLAKEINESINN